MSLQAFLNKDKRDRKNQAIEFVVSEDFKDQEGNVVPFQIKPIGFGQFSAIREQNSKTEVNNKQIIKKTNEGATTLALCAKSIVHPDLKSAELQDFYGVMTEVDLIDAMLDFKEIEKLAEKIMEISGLQQDVNELKDEAKN
jgi:superfamily I DNA/RNA helicase